MRTFPKVRDNGRFAFRDAVPLKIRPIVGNYFGNRGTLIILLTIEEPVLSMRVSSAGMRLHDNRVTRFEDVFFWAKSLRLRVVY